jgi:hypothetical protein
MATDATESWRQCFQQWPDDLPRRGVLVATFDEQIAFVNFFASDDMVLIERRAPDTVGARMVLIPYQNVAAIKITDVVKAKAFSHLNFVATQAKK